MYTYAILCSPGHSRVYFESSKALIAKELSIMSGAMSAKVTEIELRSIAGIDYLMFERAEELPPSDLAVLAQLSFIFALFRYEDGMLRPVELPDFAFIDPGISSILKYSGKTNEIFTRMLINLAYASADRSIRSGGSVRLLDPVAGKGTTLLEGLVCGFDVYGIEVGDKVVGELYTFLKKYLEHEKYKHTTKSERISGPGKSFTAKRNLFSISRDKGSAPHEFEIISGNSVNADHFYKKGFFHIIAGDLPYGVQHGNVTNEKQSGLTRNPKELLTACLPVWCRLLAKGGALALSWNTFVLSRDDMKALLEKNGLTVLDGEDYSFAHRVSQAINRDIVIAVKGG